MTTTQDRWYQDFTAVTDRLEALGAVSAINGFAFVNDTAPAALADIYRGLATVGYAKGWL